MQKRLKILGQGVSGGVKHGVYIAFNLDNNKLAIAGYAANNRQINMKLLSMEDGHENLEFTGDALSEFGNDYPVVFVNDGKNLIKGLYGFLYSWPANLEDVVQNLENSK